MLKTLVLLLCVAVTASEVAGQEPQPTTAPMPNSYDSVSYQNWCEDNTTFIGERVYSVQATLLMSEGRMSYRERWHPGAGCQEDPHGGVEYQLTFSVMPDGSVNNTVMLGGQLVDAFAFFYDPENYGYATINDQIMRDCSTAGGDHQRMVDGKQTVGADLVRCGLLEASGCMRYWRMWVLPDGMEQPQALCVHSPFENGANAHCNSTASAYNQPVGPCSVKKAFIRTDLPQSTVEMIEAYLTPEPTEYYHTTYYTPGPSKYDPYACNNYTGYCDPHYASSAVVASPMIALIGALFFFM